MRALEIATFIICFNIAVPLVAATGIFAAGPSGTDAGVAMLLWAGLALALSVGGVAIMGWSFKVPAVITSFAAIYVASVAMMNVLIYQLIQPFGVAAVFSVALTAVCTVVGGRAIMQIAGGAFGPME